MTIDEYDSYCERTGRKADRKNRARMNPRPADASKVERLHGLDDFPGVHLEGQHEIRIGRLVRVRRPISSCATTRQDTEHFALIERCAYRKSNVGKT